MSGNVRTTLYPIILMNKEGRALGGREVWEGPNDTFVAYAGKDRVDLSEDDFVFFSARGGADYAVVSNDDGEVRKAYGLITHPIETLVELPRDQFAAMFNMKVEGSRKLEEAASAVPSSTQPAGEPPADCEVTITEDILSVDDAKTNAKAKVDALVSDSPFRAAQKQSVVTGRDAPCYSWDKELINRAIDPDNPFRKSPFKGVDPGHEFIFMGRDGREVKFERHLSLRTMYGVDKDGNTYRKRFLLSAVDPLSTEPDIHQALGDFSLFGE